MRQEVRKQRGAPKLEQPTPALFLCPISLEIMRDPVIVCTGQTYDRGSIEKWIADGHRSCPITMLHLHDLTLIPNIIVRQLIDAWCASDATTSAMFASPSSTHIPRTTHQQQLQEQEELRHILQDEDSDPHLYHHQPSHQSEPELVVCLLRRIAKGQEVKPSVNRLRGLAREEPRGGGENKISSCITDAGGALLMASILADELQDILLLLSEDGDHPAQDSTCCEEIMSLLWILCRQGDSREAITNALLSESGALHCVAAHLQIGSSRITAAMLLKRLLVADQVRAALGGIPEFFTSLLSLISSSPPGAPSTKSLLKVLHRACSHKPNRPRAVHHGAVPVLVSALCATSAPSSSSGGTPHGAPRGTELALAALELLCAVDAGRRAVYDNPGAVNSAVRLLVGYSRQATEYATECLLLVCQSGPVEVMQLAIRAGARRQLLLLLQSDCSGRAKKKALELLKLFHAIFFVQGDEHVSSDFKNVDLY